MPGSGALRERLTILTAAVVAVRVTSLTRSGTTATVVTATPHGYTTGDYVRLAGADQAYNGKAKVTVVDATTFTVPCTAGLTTPATGSITSTYVSDAQGGRLESWRTLDTVAGELLPLSAGERLQLAAVQTSTLLRFRVRRRADVTTKMRATWTPSWPPQAAQLALEITGVLPWGDGRTWMQLDCTESAR